MPGIPDSTPPQSKPESQEETSNPASPIKAKQTAPPPQNERRAEPGSIDESKHPGKILADLSDSVLAPQFQSVQKNQYVQSTKATGLTVLNNFKTSFKAHPQLWTLVFAQLLLSGVPVALFLIGLAITTTIAVSVFTFFAFLVLGPVLAITGFLGFCLWGWSWAAWVVSNALWTWYASERQGGGDDLHGSLQERTVGMGKFQNF